MGKRFLCGVLLVALLGAGAEAVTRWGWLTLPEDFYYDLWHQLAGRRQAPQHTVIATIDDRTRLEHQDEPLVFWSPHFARALAVLRAAGVRVVGLDFLFSVSAESWLKKLKMPESGHSRTYDLAFREQLAAGGVVLAADLIEDEQGHSRVMLPLPDYWGSLPGNLEDVGLVKFYNDQDGVIRRFAPLMPTGPGEAWATFSQLLAERAAPGTGVTQPVSLIGFLGPPGTVPRISFRRLLHPEAGRDPQVLALKDKVVIIAYEPLGVQDIHPTPYGRGFLDIPARLMSGPEVHANIVETILTGRYPRPLAAPWRWAYLLALLAAGAVLFFRLSPGWGALSLVCLALAAGAFSYLMFLHYRVVPLGVAQAGLLLSYLGVLGLRLTGVERQRAHLRQVFGRYVSDEVVEKLLASGRVPDLGGEALAVTVLFSDIRNFTAMSESLNPHEVVELLNAYFSRVCEPIMAQGGTVDKFIGDAVMAVFGAPAWAPDHARRGIAAALAMAGTIEDFRAWVAQRFAGRGLPEFAIGVGLHTGVAVSGNIGSPQRFEFTTIGDTVNTASRLEGLSKELGWTIVASAATVEAAGPGVVTGGRQELRVKGRQEPVAVLEVKSLAGPEAADPERREDDGGQG